MLSVLIPTYNYSALTLVTEIQKQCEEIEISYEIVVLDDGSSDTFSLEENSKINEFKNCFFKKNETNLGRAKTRNSLAKLAKYNNLLFLDVDTIPVEADFIKAYSNYINTDYAIVYGGIKYQKQKPKADELLRWIYGKKREALPVNQRNQAVYLSFLTLNFLIKKEVFQTVQFNESIPNLRHEDTLFSYDLSRKKIKIIHIENPVLHLGLESSVRFLEKSEESVLGLKHLVDLQLIDANYTQLSRIYFQLKKYKLTVIFAGVFFVFVPFIKQNLRGNSPSLFLFDLYRLYYYISQRETKIV